MNRIMYRPMVMTLLAGAILGCADDTSSGHLTPTPDRSPQDRSWDLLFAVGGAGDTVLQSPLQVAVTTDRIAVYDDGRRSLLMFDSTGQVLWSVGRGGQGPGEFLRVRDIAFDDDGALLVVDAGNGRLMRIVDGEVLDEIRIESESGPLEGILPGKGENLVLVVGSPPLLTIDQSGSVVSRDEFPYVDPEVHPMAEQAVAIGSTDDWALAFVFGGGWIRKHGHTSFYRSLVEDPGFPTVELSGKFDARLVGASKVVEAISLNQGIVYLHTYARDEGQGYIDRFDGEDGTYIGSWKLPPAAAQGYTSSVSKELIAVLKADPSPTLLVYRN